VHLGLVAKSRGRRFSREIALRLAGHFVPDEEFPHRGGTQQRGVVDRVEPATLMLQAVDGRPCQPIEYGNGL